MQSASARELAERRAEIVTALTEVAELEFVNGGGTGSIELTAAEWAVTEVAAGSGFFAPVLFDHYRSFTLRPAAMFALPVVRSPARGVATALGGGYLASGVGAKDRMPVPHLPAGSARLLRGRRRGADAAARLAAPSGSRSATASTSATSRPASSASGSTASTWSPGRRSATRCPPTGARARRFSRRGRPRSKSSVQYPITALRRDRRRTTFAWRPPARGDRKRK